MSIFLVDAISYSVAAFGASTDNSPVITVGLLGVALGGPIMHAAHERPGRALGSLALRTIVPITGAYVAIEASHCSGSFCDLGQAAVAFGLLLATAHVLDWAVLSRAPGETPRASATTRRSGVTWQPAVSVSRDGARTAGIAGSW